VTSRTAQKKGLPIHISPLLMLVVSDASFTGHSSNRICMTSTSCSAACTRSRISKHYHLYDHLTYSPSTASVFCLFVCGSLSCKLRECPLRICDLGFHKCTCVVCVVPWVEFSDVVLCRSSLGILFGLFIAYSVSWFRVCPLRVGG